MSNQDILDEIEFLKHNKRGNGPLCNKYESCTGCPVSEKTGQMSCNGTPYQINGDNDRMIEFLKKLLVNEQKIVII